MEDRLYSSRRLVENMAYMKQTWTNDRHRSFQPAERGGLRLRSSRETNGDSSLAVDGVEEASNWSKCATISNEFVQKPMWMVDLGRMKNIAGVMLRTGIETDLGMMEREIDCYW